MSATPKPAATAPKPDGPERLRSVSGRRKKGAGRLGATTRPGREQVAEIQRLRIIAAMAELVHERGIAHTTVAHIVSRSGVSRRTFYEIFEDRDACLLATLDDAVERATAVVLPAYRSAGDPWAERARAGLGALLAFLDAYPRLGALCVVEALAGDRAMLDRRAEVVQALVDAVHRDANSAVRVAAAPRVERVPGGGDLGRRVRGAADGASPADVDKQPRIVAEGLVGAVLAIVHSRIDERQPLTGLLNQLMSILVLPYLGAAAAAAERARTVPRARRRASAIVGDPLRELDMRLTYRTVRVLRAISEHPRASGREVADAAGVGDQGQISKLLWRLAHLGLIANDVSSSGRGEANAWVLTARGEQVHAAICA